MGGLVLADGRFAIVLRKEWGDLRKLIDIRMTQIEPGKGRPFGDVCAKKVMSEIAIGMRQLHSHGILHRELKSSSVLVSTSAPLSSLHDDIEGDAFHVKVIDFENSDGVVVRTGCWRSPEVLLAMKQGNFGSTYESNKSDVYAYAMTCYEVLTGHLPSVGWSSNDHDPVLSGKRPRLPDDMDNWLRDLIQQCWHQDPSRRPEFEDIVEIFKSKFPDPTTHLVEEEVEASKSHWSEIGTSHQDALQGETNHQIFESLKQHPGFSKFFGYTFRNLKPGRKIAEGAQAAIFEAEFEKENGVKVLCVVKLFKHISLRDMVKQWPPGMLRGGDSSNHLRFGFMGHFSGATRTCEVLGATVDEDDSFAFIFNREGGDLRTLIEHRMKQPSNRKRPFKRDFVKRIMYEIALGMRHLHDHDILHRDLKAANVLVTNVFGEFPGDPNDELIDIKVADFECSMLVKGTLFWRAPEILKQLHSGTELRFTRKADVYSYAMTCCEVLTGGIPLNHLRVCDYAAVYERGERPTLSRGWFRAFTGRLPWDFSGDGWLRALIERCWHPQPSERPEFKEIVEEFEKNCPYLN